MHKRFAVFKQSNRLQKIAGYFFFTREHLKRRETNIHTVTSLEERRVDGWNRAEWCLSSALKLLKSLWTVGCLDVASACPASARCCSEMKRPHVLEEPKSSHACSHKTLISPHTARTLFSPSIFPAFVIAERVWRDGVGVHLWATPDASVSTRVATGNTVCYDGERNGLDNVWPGALV